MDVSINGIHYINLDKVVLTTHIKKCYSIEYQQSLLWLIAQTEPLLLNDINMVVHDVLSKLKL
jgi:hypothetical protein